MTEMTSQYDCPIPKRGRVLVVAESARHFSRYVKDNGLEKRATWAHHEALVRHASSKTRCVIILNGAHKAPHYKEIMFAVAELRDRTRGFAICRRNY